MPIQAVIFDMDGVLVDSEVYWIKSRQEFAQSLGKTWTLEDQRLAMGRNTVEWAAVMQERLNLDMSIDVIITEIKRRVIAHYEKQMPVLPGAMEAVHTAAQGYPIALASGSPKDIIDHVMHLTGLNKVFEFIVYADDMPNGKPAPDVYFETARLLKVSPADCVGIEDSVNGVRSLHAAGMRIIAVPSPAFPLPENIAALAHLLLPSLEGFTLDTIRSLDV